MIKYKCNECGNKFETPWEYEEYRGEYWGVAAYETMYCCPYCNSDEYEECDDDEEEEI